MLTEGIILFPTLGSVWLDDRPPRHDVSAPVAILFRGAADRLCCLGSDLPMDG